MKSPALPGHLWVLAAFFGVASALHFAHNAEFIADYPGMPAWLTREGVYLAWCAVTAVGLLATVVAAVGRRLAAALLLVVYGALGLDALGHYALALCSEHTLATNLTIGFEVGAGAMLAIAAARFAARGRGQVPLAARERA